MKAVAAVATLGVSMCVLAAANLPAAVGAAGIFALFAAWSWALARVRR